MISREKYTSGLYLLISIVVVLVLYSGTIKDLFVVWSSEANTAYSHGFLLAAVSAFILYKEWRNAPRIILKPGVLPVMALLILSITWFLAALGSIQIIQMLLLIVILSTVFWALLGFSAARVFLFPFFLMLGAMPIWEVIGPYLQITTAVVAGELTRWTITPSIREGLFIIIPAGTFEVEAGCSGVGYFIVAVIISALYCYINQIKWFRAIAFVMVAMAVAVVANFIRVYIIILSGHMTNMESYLITVDHVSLGWGVFAVGITGYLWMANKFIPAQEIHKIESSAEAAKKSIITELTTAQSVVYFILLLSVVSAGPIIYDVYKTKYNKASIPDQSLPAKIGNYVKTPSTGEYRPNFGEGLYQDEAIYTDKKQSIYLYKNYYYTQSQGHEAVNDMHSIADRKFWKIISNKHRDMPSLGVDSLHEAHIISTNRKEKLVWQWYETNNIKTGQKIRAKYENILAYVQGDPSITVILASVDIEDNIETARLNLKQFLIMYYKNKEELNNEVPI